MTEILSLIIAIIAVIISMKAWHKNRVIYGIERKVIAQLDSIYSYSGINGTGEDKLNKKLNSGNYSVLAVMKGSEYNKWEILLGRITPYKKKND